MKVNWLLRLYIYGSISTLVGPFYDNWASLERYLYRSGVYYNQCNEEDPEDGHKETWSCEKQHESVNMLLTVSRAAECAGSFLIGVLMDWEGPKITAVLGVVIRIIGWSLIGFLPHVNAAVIASFSMLGLSVNFIIIPALTVVSYAGKYRFFAVVQIGMFSCLSSMVLKLKMYILDSGKLTKEQINYMYTIFILLPCLAISAYIFPWKIDREKVGEDIEMEVKKENVVLHQQDGEYNENVADATWTWSGLLRTLVEKEVFTCLIYFSFNFGSITFIQQIFSVIYADSPKLLSLIEYIIAFAFIPCCIMSVLFLYISPIWMMIGLNAIGGLMHVLAIMDSFAAGFIVSLCLMTTFCVLHTKVYNYLDQFLDGIYMGSIVGSLNTLCGVWLIVQGLLSKGHNDPKVLRYINYGMLVGRILFLIPFLCFTFLIPKRIKRAQSVTSLSGGEGKLESHASGTQIIKVV
ncbi:hypothetical protein BgAZ_206790 [Babesia gibsoni]|uniref:Transporter n=1 Tax=Babesia gibsoni TaxID=33632 RepID=A0AAD8UU27_BABGI|nr:hypothetical protein BgAZ_206790 [Babesia gibsoni]